MNNKVVKGLTEAEKATLRATTNLKTPDAIHATTALSVNSSFFLTNDRAFRNAPTLPTIILDDVIASPSVIEHRYLWAIAPTVQR